MHQMNMFELTEELPPIGTKIKYESVGKIYKGEVIGYEYHNKYIHCTTNCEDDAGVSLHIDKLGEHWWFD